MNTLRNLRCENGHVFDRTRYGNTCPYCHMVVHDGREAFGIPKALSELEDMLLIEEISPVCGWLVCIDGSRRGLSYSLYYGKNFIGRADDMTVQLLGDSGVARRNHAIIAYDPKNRQFMLVPGESEGLVYLNGKSIFHATLLTDMSIIQLGSTQLLFRPLCGNNFEWS